MIRHQRQDVVAGVQQMLHYIEEADAFILQLWAFMD